MSPGVEAPAVPPQSPWAGPVALLVGREDLKPSHPTPLWLLFLWVKKAQPAQAEVPSWFQVRLQVDSAASQSGGDLRTGPALPKERTSSPLEQRDGARVTAGSWTLAPPACAGEQRLRHQ